MVRSRGVRTFTSKPNDQCNQSVVAVFEVMRLSGLGTFETSRNVGSLAAIGGKAEVAPTSQTDAIDSERTFLCRPVGAKRTT